MTAAAPNHGQIQLVVTIPLTEHNAGHPEDLPDAGTCTDWLTDQYRTPAALITDYDNDAHITMTVTWLGSHETCNWTPAGGWQPATHGEPA